MEILGVDGLLTDQEVIEVFKSDSFFNIRSFHKHDAARHALVQQLNRIKRQLNPPQQQPGAPGRPPQHNISDERRHVLEAQVQHMTKQLAKMQRVEDITWLRTHTLAGLANSPAAVQTAKDVSTFFSALGALAKKHGFEILPHEAIQLVNLRPMSSVEMHVIIEQYSERVRSPEARDALEALIASLPEPRASGTDAAADDDDNEEEEEAAAAAAAAPAGTTAMSAHGAGVGKGVSKGTPGLDEDSEPDDGPLPIPAAAGSKGKGKGKGPVKTEARDAGEDEEDVDADALDDMLASDEHARAMRDENEFTTDAKAQVDADNDGNDGATGGDDGEGAIPRNRGWRR